MEISDTGDMFPSDFLVDLTHSGLLMSSPASYNLQYNDVTVMQYIVTEFRSGASLNCLR